MVYKCQFPGCMYKTKTKSQINYHHVIPKELDGVDDKYNRIYLCPTHHTKVYVPDSKNGIHSIKGEDSIIILRWVQSTYSRILEYIDKDGILKYYEYF